MSCTHTALNSNYTKFLLAALVAPTQTLRRFSLCWWTPYWFRRITKKHLALEFLLIKFLDTYSMSIQENVMQAIRFFEFKHFGNVSVDICTRYFEEKIFFCNISRLFHTFQPLADFTISLNSSQTIHSMSLNSFNYFPNIFPTFSIIIFLTSNITDCSSRRVWKNWRFFKYFFSLFFEKSNTTVARCCSKSGWYFDLSNIAWLD